MATAQQVAEIRANVQEPLNTEPYTDEFIGSLIDAYGMTETEHKIWVAKRNNVAALVDISEGGSSRKMSQVFERYNAIVQGYENPATGAASGRQSMTREITRA